MKINTAFHLSLLACIASVSADKHLLCCCSTKAGCDIASTQQVINERSPPGSWVMNHENWTKELGAPFACMDCYASAINMEGMDDGWIGGVEMSRACDKLPSKKGSSCFSPKGRKEEGPASTTIGKKENRPAASKEVTLPLPSNPV
ncbi:L-galactonate dehydratase [Venturia nashicola]|uniref:L-galactonate dehydratase n=1 Tax=Venturia nashicola TaxID=86259 RepID=A0A4Z1PI78_9PEZI|nr:L-galactonate dehydratase [Venturia nashicola]TLD39364.1 L-galactonate dehydratase [Venturia nashicola]